MGTSRGYGRNGEEGGNYITLLPPLAVTFLLGLCPEVREEESDGWAIGLCVLRWKRRKGTDGLLGCVS